MSEEVNKKEKEEVKVDLKNKNFKSKTFMIPPEYIARFDAIKQKLNLSDSKIFNLMLLSFENGENQNISNVVVSNVADVEKYKDEISELNKKVYELNETIDNLNLELQEKSRDVEKYYNRNLEYELEVNKLNTDLNSIDKRNDDLQSKVDEVNNGNNVIVRMKEPERKLLDEVLKRLSERQNIEISKSDYFRVIFLRYNIERWSEWFHKFVLSDKDIETISGVSKKNWISFLNK